MGSAVQRLCGTTVTISYPLTMGLLTCETEGVLEHLCESVVLVIAKPAGGVRSITKWEQGVTSLTKHEGGARYTMKPVEGVMPPGK